MLLPGKLKVKVDEKTLEKHLNLYRPRTAVGNVSGNRCESDFRFRGRELDPGLILYFRGD